MSAWAKDILAGIALVAFITLAMCALPLLAPDGAAGLRHAIGAAP